MTLLGSDAPTSPPPAPGTGLAGWWARLGAGRRTAVTVAATMAVSAVLHLLWWWLLPTSGGDIAAQDEWAEFARQHPGSAYNLAWYGGMHPVSYSVISPYLMAVLGVRPTMVLVGTLTAGLLAWLVGRIDLPPARRGLLLAYGVLALVGNAVSGRVTFGLGALLAVVAVGAVWAWPERWARHPAGRRARNVVGAVAAGLATAASPVAGLFLGIGAAALWLGGRRGTSYVLGLPPVAVVALSAVLFPFSGVQPMSWSSAVLPALAGVAVAVLVPREWRTVRTGAAVYVVAVVLAWLVPSPVGTNVSRLGLLLGGILLVAVALLGSVGGSVAARRLGVGTARVLLVVAVLTTSVWQVATAARDSVATNPPSVPADDLAPLVAALRSRDADLGRVEAVPTRSHVEASGLADHVNLARGWNRQADAERNPLFYDEEQPLTAASYRRWLHRWAVQYVVVSEAEPDPAAVAERDLVTGGLPYLDTVWTDGSWTLLQVRRPTPLVRRPATVVSFGAARLVLDVPEPGRYVVRIASSPWLSLVDRAGEPLEETTAVSASTGTPPAQPCLSEVSDRPGYDAEVDAASDAGETEPDDWAVLHAPRAGTYRIAAPYSFPRGSSCD